MEEKQWRKETKKKITSLILFLSSSTNSYTKATLRFVRLSLALDVDVSISSFFHPPFIVHLSCDMSLILLLQWQPA